MKRSLLLILFSLAVLPLSAQENLLNIVTFNGFQLQYPQDWASIVEIVQVPAEDFAVSEQVYDPAYTYISFGDGYTEGRINHLASSIYVYKIADLASYPHYLAHVTKLQMLVDTQTDLTIFQNLGLEGLTVGDQTALPYLPVMPFMQVLRSKPAYMETETLRGIRYITTFQEYGAPFTSQNFQYIFQAVSRDGQYYVAAGFGLTTSLFPEVATEAEIDNFTADWGQYLNDTEALLNAAQPMDFTPNLAVVEAMFALMEIE